MGEEISNLLRRMGPSEEVQGHFRSARIEMMKGLRAMLDEKIDKAQRAQQAQRGSTVTVD
jgi:RAB protein geranylgeranyltransferase component A